MWAAFGSPILFLGHDAHHNVSAMRRKRRAPGTRQRQPRAVRLAAALGVVLAVTAGVIVSFEIRGWPILRTARYRLLLDEYAKASRLSSGKTDSGLNWNAEIRLPASVGVRVESRGFMDIVRLHYADEPRPRPLYEYEDYSNVVSIKTAGGRLYVHWAETLIHTDDWLLSYDLANRRELTRTRVAPADIRDRD